MNTLYILVEETEIVRLVGGTYRKIPKISPGAYIFQRPFLRGFFFGGASIRKGLPTEGNLRLKLDRAIAL